MSWVFIRNRSKRNSANLHFFAEQPMASEALANFQRHLSLPRSEQRGQGGLQPYSLQPCAALCRLAPWSSPPPCCPLLQAAAGRNTAHHSKTKDRNQRWGKSIKIASSLLLGERDHRVLEGWGGQRWKINVPGNGKDFPTHYFYLPSLRVILHFYFPNIPINLFLGKSLLLCLYYFSFHTIFVALLRPGWWKIFFIFLFL